jgi:hypothetical protein
VKPSPSAESDPMFRLIAVLALLSFTACTRWSTQTVYGQKYEVERHLLGSPAVEETSSSSLSGGFSHASASETDRSRHHTFHDGASFGSFGGDTASSKMTHCVQQAEIHYKQPYQVVASETGRTYDIAGAATAIFAGAIIMLIADVQAQTIFAPGDPLYTPPPSAVPGFVMGGVAIAGGLGLLAYSFGRLPKGTPPSTEHGEQDVVETDYVEATGCGLPGDPTVQR